MISSPLPRLYYVCLGSVYVAVGWRPVVILKIISQLSTPDRRMDLDQRRIGMILDKFKMTDRVAIVTGAGRGGGKGDRPGLR
jgi:hypothetical protein